MIVHYMMVQMGVLEIFHFEQESVRGDATPLTVDDIRPPDDPGAEVFWPAVKRLARTR